MTGRRVEKKRYPRAGRRKGAGRTFCLALIVFFVLTTTTVLVNKSMGKIMSESVSQKEPPQELSPDLQFDRLVVDKAERRLTAYAGGETLRVYCIALGPNPVGHKEREGDGKTPEGVYFVDGKNPNSKFYKNLGVSYPNEADRAAAVALGVAPGGDIKIHGLPPGQEHLGPVHWMQDWTAGCIAVSNEEIDELYVHTPLGTPIEIRP